MTMSARRSNTAFVLFFILITAIWVKESHAISNNTTLHHNNSSQAKNGTESGPSFNNEPFRIFQIFFCIIVIVVGVVGNFLVILVFLIRCDRLKTCEVFMVSLAVADLMGSFTIPLDILRRLLDAQDTRSGDFFGCQLGSWLGTTCISVSAITLIAIAIDRFVIVAWPLKARYGNSLTVYLLVVLTWIIGGSFGLIVFFRLVQHFDPGTETVYCLFNYKSPTEKKAHNISLFILQMVIPMGLMTGLYSFITFKLRPGSVAARRLSECDNVTRIRNRRQRKATKLFVTVVVVFYCLVFPSNLFHVLLSFGHIKHTQSVVYVYNVLTLLLVSNSCVNPIIYSRLHKSFRRSTISLLFGWCMPKYWKYDWENKFVSRSSYRRRLTHSHYLHTTIRTSASPNQEEAPGLPSMPRSSSATSPVSNRTESTGSDDVFYRRSLKVGFCKDADNVRIHLDNIPEQDITKRADNGSELDDAFHGTSIGKYTRFSNISLDGSLTNGRQISQESSSTIVSDLDRVPPANQNAPSNGVIGNGTAKNCTKNDGNNGPVTKAVDPNDIRL